MTELSATDATSKGMEVVPTPRINLSNLELVRLEASRVYRDMRAGLIASQDGSRLIYSLVSISKMIEAEAAQQQLSELAVVGDSLPDSMVGGIDLDKLTEKELDTLEAAMNILDCIREGRPILDPPPELFAYATTIRSERRD